MEKTPYIIRGGIDGCERLRILAHVLQPTTLKLIDRWKSQHKKAECH
jgi:hypothetical protein